MPSQAFRDAAYPRHSDDATIVCLTVTYPARPTLRICNAAGTWNATLKTYVFTALGRQHICAPFDITMPQRGEDEPVGQLTIQNVDRRIGQTLSSMIVPARVTATTVLESAPSAAIDGPYRGMRLRNVRIDAMAATGDLRWPDLASTAYPVERARIAKYPALGLLR